MYEELRGKTVLISGAGKKTGIGFGIASVLARCGMRIVLADIPASCAPSASMDDCCRALREQFGAEVHGLPLDVTCQDSVEDAAAFMKRLTAGEPLHALINNAGIMLSAASIAETPLTDWQKTMDVNLNGVFRMMRTFTPLLSRGSVIINMASRAGKRPAAGYSPYSVSKAGVIMLTKCYAVEYGSRGIRANAVCPGQIMTDLQSSRYASEARQMAIPYGERLEQARKSIPLERIGTIQDVGLLVAFLISDGASYLTGQTFNVCGGQLVEL